MDYNRLILRLSVSTLLHPYHEGTQINIHNNPDIHDICTDEELKFSINAAACTCNCIA